MDGVIHSGCCRRSCIDRLPSLVFESLLLLLSLLLLYLHFLPLLFGVQRCWPYSCYLQFAWFQRDLIVVCETSHWFVSRYRSHKCKLISSTCRKMKSSNNRWPDSVDARFPSGIPFFCLNWLLDDNPDATESKAATQDDHEKLLDQIKPSFLHNNGTAHNVWKNERRLVNGNVLNLIEQVHCSVQNVQLKLCRGQGRETIDVHAGAASETNSIECNRCGLHESESHRRTHGSWHGYEYHRNIKLWQQFFKPLVNKINLFHWMWSNDGYKTTQLWLFLFSLLNWLWIALVLRNIN